MDHSLLSPSSAHRWAYCSASLARCAGYAEKTSEFAEEGRQAHNLAETLLRGEKAEGADPEMLGYVEQYVGAVKAMSEGADCVWIEEKLDLSDVLGVKGSIGTADYMALYLKTGELQVHDLKYGKGVKVDADDNLQLIIYGLGAIEIASFVGSDIKKVKLVIHQPRLNHVSEKEYSIEEMMKWGTWLRLRAAEAMVLIGQADINPILYSPGQKQCQWCPAKGECEALAQYSLDIIAGEFEDVSLKPKLEKANEAVPAAHAGRLAELYGNLDLITQWVAAVRERTMQLMLGGTEVPGWKLVEGRAGNRKWSDDSAAEEAMKRMRLKVEEMYKMKIISPSDAEKLLKKNPRKWKKLVDLITRSEALPAIAPASDKRPALVLSATVNEFDDII